MFDMKDVFPAPVTVKLSRGKNVTVPVISFKAQLESLLSDPDLMKEENLLQNNFDLKTMRPTKRYKEYGPYDTIDDINNGYLYHQGIKLYCSQEPPPGVDRVIPTPLIACRDECNTDKNRALVAETVSITIGW